MTPKRDKYQRHFEKFDEYLKCRHCPDIVEYKSHGSGTTRTIRTHLRRNHPHLLDESECLLPPYLMRYFIPLEFPNFKAQCKSCINMLGADIPPLSYIRGNELLQNHLKINHNIIRPQDEQSTSTSTGVTGPPVSSEEEFKAIVQDLELLLTTTKSTLTSTGVTGPPAQHERQESPYSLPLPSKEQIQQQFMAMEDFREQQEMSTLDNDFLSNLDEQLIILGMSLDSKLDSKKRTYLSLDDEGSSEAIKRSKLDKPDKPISDSNQSKPGDVDKNEPGPSGVRQPERKIRKEFNKMLLDEEAEDSSSD